MKWAGVGSIVGVYALYTLFYLIGRDGTADYFFVNNDFFIVPLLAVALLVSSLVTIWAVRRYLGAPREDRSIRLFIPAAVCLVLTLVFVPYAFVLSFSEYLSS